MSEFGKDWPLWEFKCRREDLFSQLNNEIKGIALVKLPHGLNPQGLVDKYSEEVADRNLLQSPESFHSISFYSAPDIMFDRYASPDAAARRLFNLRQDVFRTVGEIAADALLPHTKTRSFIDVSGARLWAYDNPNHQAAHSDNNFLTAFLGSTASGHVMQLPDHNEYPLARLPAGYVLYTRQREWCYLHPDFSSAGGISHSVDWSPSDTEPFRAVGLHFIGK